jgi:hypothetical protein
MTSAECSCGRRDCTTCMKVRIPVAVGEVWRTLEEATEAYAVAVRLPFMRGREPGPVGHQWPVEFERWHALMSERYRSQPVRALARCELSERHEPHLHVLVFGPNLKRDTIRALWQRATPYCIPDVQPVHSPGGLAAYIFKQALVACLQDGAACEEILELDRQLNGGSYGRQHHFFEPGHPKLAVVDSWRGREMLRVTRGKQTEWVERMSYHVRESLKRQRPLTPEMIDEIMRGIEF